MAETELQTLMCAIREQLDHYGLREAFSPNPLSKPEPDMNAIRLTIEREEKQYLLAANK